MYINAVCSQVPEQDNFSDCGVFLLHYVGTSKSDRLVFHTVRVVNCRLVLVWVLLINAEKFTAKPWEDTRKEWVCACVHMCVWMCVWECVYVCVG